MKKCGKVKDKRTKRNKPINSISDNLICKTKC